jgi:hypothetical protein
MTHGPSINSSGWLSPHRHWSTSTWIFATNAPSADRFLDLAVLQHLMETVLHLILMFEQPVD